MADDAPAVVRPGEKKPAPGGGSMGKKVGGLPVYTWAVIGGVGVAVLWAIYRSRKAAPKAASPDQTQSGGYPSYGAPATTIVPTGQGLSESQYAAILREIQKLHGKKSKRHHDDDDDKDDDKKHRSGFHTLPRRHRRGDDD